MTHQYLYAFVFYAVFSLTAVIGWPLAKRTYQNFSAAYVLSKILGLAAFGYIIWLLSSLRFLNYQRKSLIITAYLITVAVILFWQAGKRGSFAGWKEKIFAVCKIEALSLFLYYVFLYVRSFNGAAFGTEKLMDMAMFSATGKTSYFPPLDSWMAGETINYYYFGHYLFSLLANLSHTIYSLAYNYSLALIFALTAVLAWTLIFQITKSKVFAVLGTFLVVAAGSMAYAQCTVADFFKHQSCYFGSSTRLLTPSYIINEIPSYSFTVGDLHAHLMALPFFLASLLLLWKIFKERENSKWAIFALSFIAAIEGAINSWDLITILSLIFLLCLYKIIFEKERGKRLWSRLALFLGPIAAYGILLYPYWHNMKSQIGGLGFAPSFVKAWSNRFTDFQYPSPLYVLLGMWGAFVIISLILLFFVRKDNLSGKTAEKKFSVLLFVGALCIIVGTELFFIKDIYSVQNPPYFRANTVFKFGYHAWTLFSVSFVSFSALALEKLKTFSEKKRKFIAVSGSALGLAFLAASLVYPYQGTEQFYIRNDSDLTLNGTDFIKNKDIGDIQTIDWINMNIKNRAVLLEAVGDSYTYFGRMSAFTGMINPVNWTTHEWTWRYVYPKMTWKQMAAAAETNTLPETGYAPVSARSSDVQEIYLSRDPELTRELLKKYNIKFVYIGALERQTYRTLQEQKFHSLGTMVFATNDSELFEIK